MMNRVPFSRSSRPQDNHLKIPSAVTPLSLTDIKRGNSVANLTSKASQHNYRYASPMHSTFLPNLPGANGKSRIDKSVRNRSHQILNKMKSFKNMSILQGGGEIGIESSRPKFREPIANSPSQEQNKRNVSRLYTHSFTG